MDVVRLLLLWPLMLLVVWCPSAVYSAPQVGTGTGSATAPVAAGAAVGLVPADGPQYWQMW